MTTITLYKPAGVTVEVITRDSPPVVAVPDWATEAALPPGQVRRINRNSIASVWQGHPPAGGGSIYKAVDASSSGVDAPLLGRFGSKVGCWGGDADGWDTAAYAFDYATQLWSRIKNRTEALTWVPGADPQFNVEFGEHGDGTPAVPHSYDALCYLPPDVAGTPAGAVLWPLRRYFYPQRKSNHAHQLTLGAAPQWQRITQAPLPVSLNAEAMAEYDPTTELVWIVSTSRGGGWVNNIAAFNPRTGTATLHQLGTAGQRFLVAGLACMRFWRGLDGTRRYLVWFQLGRAQIIDLDNLAAGVRVPSMPALERPPLPALYDGPGLAWGAGSWWFKLAGPESHYPLLHRITPQSDLGEWSVEEITLPGVTGASVNGLWKKLHYVESLNALTWYAHADGVVYAYRPEGV